MGAYPRSQMLNDAAIKAVAQKVGRTVGEVVLKWEMMTGANIVIPRSKTPAHMTENMGFFNVTLSAQDVATLSKLPQSKIC